MKIFNVIKYQLYLLQLENYELVRYFVLLFKKGILPPVGLRKSLVWTKKALLLFSLAVATHLVLPAVVFFYFTSGLSVVSVRYYALCALLLTAYYLLQFLYFILYTLYSVLFWPLDFIVKQIIIKKAKFKVKYLGSRIKIIGIAGSYGKTTMKHALTKVLGEKFKVLSTPESVNTSIGVARWILKEVDESAQILIIEMGEHYRGDIEALCKIARPDISVITGINEAHLERMGSLDEIASTVFEAVSYSKPGAVIVLNGDDKNVMGLYKEFVWKDHRVEKFQISNFKFQKFNAEELFWTGNHPEAGEIKIHLLGEYALGYADAAIQVAKSFVISWEEVRRGIEKIKPVEHRLQPIRSAGDLLIIDDAYNGNPEGASEAIRVLSRIENRRKVYITPGLVEMGKATKEVHIEIGEQLVGVADIVVLIKNSVTPSIELGIKNRTEIIWFNTAQEAHSKLSTILKPGDVVVFQNDWGDNYV
ncbi:MAG: UDP-N-acetylmuramoyl-tripeptide--D-alanyl-D-alanine ligase [Candidatus Doudnabacteria bacterium]|nr:UDP-N-acetylmuramoyl-tripeptide--D-alanyl-D-alanine ligase [Candidatus Doudnabacteria bacterium]